MLTLTASGCGGGGGGGGSDGGVACGVGACRFGSGGALPPAPHDICLARAPAKEPEVPTYKPARALKTKRREDSVTACRTQHCMQDSVCRTPSPHGKTLYAGLRHRMAELHQYGPDLLL